MKSLTDPVGSPWRWQRHAAEVVEVANRGEEQNTPESYKTLPSHLMETIKTGNTQ